MLDLYSDNANIVIESVLLGEMADVIENTREEFLWRKRRVTVHGGVELFLTKYISALVFYFEQPVGEKHDEITFRHRSDGSAVARCGNNSHGRPGESVPLKFLGGRGTLFDVKRTRMAGVGKPQLGVFHIGDEVKRISR